MTRPIPIHDKDESLNAAIELLLVSYGKSARRTDTSAVDRLMEVCGADPLPKETVVVGTNGKSTTATYMSRILEAQTTATGLFTSPHLHHFNERFLVNGKPVNNETLLGNIQYCHEQARKLNHSDFKFFDILTVAARLIFTEMGVHHAVFEAGIGGRLDASHALRPSSVILTSVGHDHADVLGETHASVLWEKLLVAAPGAVITSGRLSPGLEDFAQRIASYQGFDISFVESDEGKSIVPSVRAAGLAMLHNTRLAGKSVPFDMWMPARNEHREFEGIPVVIDVAHNEDAWRNLLSTAPTSSVVIFGLSQPRDYVQSLSVLAASGKVSSVVICPPSLRPAETTSIAGMVWPFTVQQVSDLRTALRSAVHIAKQQSSQVYVTGSLFLAAECLRILDNP